MKKVLLLHFLLSSLLYGYVYDKLLLTTHAVILPKLMMLDKQFDDKVRNGTVVFTIVYEKPDRETATWFASVIQNHYNKRIGNYPLRIETVSYENIDHAVESTAYYAFNSPKNFSRLYNVATSKQQIIFAYDLANLTSTQGALITIMNEKTTKIYLNKPMLSSYQVKFIPMFYQIAELINE